MSQKPFDQLTIQGQNRRLRRLAVAALAHYNLSVRQVRLHAVETNTIFRIDTADKQKYALRIGAPNEHTLADNQAEVAWLTALKQDTPLNIAEPVALRDGRYIATVSAPGVPVARRCVLFRWIPGHPLEEYLSPDTYHQLGLTAAALHDHAQQFSLPPKLQPMRWDRVFYYPNEPVIIFSEQYRHLFPPKRLKLLRQVIANTQKALTELHRNKRGKMVIHGDLHMWNVHWHRGQLYVLDFEDLMWGYPVQDIAITLFYGREREDYETLRTAFRKGYTSRRPWPVQYPGQLEAFMAARSVSFINYVTHLSAEPQDFIERVCQRLENYLARFGS